MNRFLKLGICLYAWILLGNQGHLRADTNKTPERTSIDQVGMAMSLYSRTHNGQVAASWEQIRTVYDLDRINSNLARSNRAPLQDRYQFLIQNIRTLNEQGQVLLVRSIPLERIEKDERGEEKRVRWRYMVTRSKNGNIAATRVSEEEVQATFQKAGVPLPPPKPGDPAVETEDVPPPYDQPEQASTTPTPTIPTKQPASPAPTSSAPSVTAPTPTAPVAETPSRWLWIVVAVLVLMIGWFVWKRRE